MIAGMDERIPLPTLLSQVLVAFTIEADNEFEHRMPHRTTNHGRHPGDGEPVGRLPWLVSLAMWARFLRFVDEDGVRADELAKRTGQGRVELTRTLERLAKWWGYLEVEPGASWAKPGPDWVVRPTVAGRKALGIWRGLCGEIEKRWERRFGRDEVEELRAALEGLSAEIAAATELDWPEYLPILGYGLFSKAPAARRTGAVQAATGGQLPLTALLSRVLLAFAMEFEEGFELSLALCANLLRVLDEQGVSVRELPARSGVSKESIEMGMGFLKKRGAVTLATERGRRGKVARLTPLGRAAQDAYRERVRRIEAGWQKRWGKTRLAELRKTLERLAIEDEDGRQRLFAGLEPYPDNWRAEVDRMETLPHYPMVLHRGGFPDGS